MHIFYERFKMVCFKMTSVKLKFSHLVFVLVHLDQDLNRLNDAVVQDPSPQSDLVQNLVPRRLRKKMRQSQDQGQNQKNQNLVPNPLREKAKSRTKRASMSLVMRALRGMVTRKTEMKRKMLSR